MFNQFLTVAFCLALPIAGIVVTAFIGTRARFEMADQIDRLKVNGVYAKWAGQNWKVIWLERLSLAGFLASLTGIVVLSPVSVDLGRLAFIAFIVCTILCVTTFFLFYKRIMQAQLPSVSTSEYERDNKIGSTIKGASIIVAVLALVVYASRKWNRGNEKRVKG